MRIQSFATTLAVILYNCIIFIIVFLSSTVQKQSFWFQLIISGFLFTESQNQSKQENMWYPQKPSLFNVSSVKLPFNNLRGLSHTMSAELPQLFDKITCFYVKCNKLLMQTTKKSSQQSHSSGRSKQFLLTPTKRLTKVIIYHISPLTPMVECMYTTSQHITDVPFHYRRFNSNS